LFEWANSRGNPKNFAIIYLELALRGFSNFSQRYIFKLDPSGYQDKKYKLSERNA